MPEDECKHQVSLTSESKSDTSRLGPPPDLLAWGLSCCSSSLSQLWCRFLGKCKMEGTVLWVQKKWVNIKVKELVWQKWCTEGEGERLGGERQSIRRGKHQEEPKIATYAEAVIWSDMWHCHYENTLMYIPSLGIQCGYYIDSALSDWIN